MEQIIDTELIQWLDGKTNYELRSISRKACRLYLEETLHCDLTPHKEHIKQVLKVDAERIMRMSSAKKKSDKEEMDNSP